MSDAFDSERYLALLRTRGSAFGEPLTYLPVTDSTNDAALAAARSGGPAGSVFVAGEQRRGRGRRGSEWHSTPEASLAFSILLRPNVTAERASGLSLVAGLAVRQAVAAELERAGNARAPSVKWPNDVLISGKKVAGILVESVVQGGRLTAAVVGVGLNVGRVTLPSDVQKRATSLAEAGARAEREELVVRILEELATRLAGLMFGDPGEMLPKSLLAEFERYDALRGVRVLVDGKSGLGAGIDSAGNLLVDDESGRRCRIGAGHVEILGLAFESERP